MSYLDTRKYEEAFKRYSAACERRSWDEEAARVMKEEEDRLSLRIPSEEIAPTYWKIEEAVQNVYIWYGFLGVTPEMFTHIADLDTCWAVLGYMERHDRLISLPIPFSEEGDRLVSGLFLLTPGYIRAYQKEHIEKTAWRTEWERLQNLHGWAKFAHRVKEHTTRLTHWLKRLRFQAPLRLLSEPGSSRTSPK